MWESVLLFYGKMQKGIERYATRCQAYINWGYVQYENSILTYDKNEKRQKRDMYIVQNVMRKFEEEILLLFVRNAM